MAQVSHDKKELDEVRARDGELKARYQYVHPRNPRLRSLVYISNPTDELQMFRVCKNGKPIAFPLVKPHYYKIVHIKDYMHVREEDVITVTEHLEEYIYDGTEFD